MSHTASDSNRLCIISISRGRKFLHCPKRHSNSIIFKARLAGKLVSTEKCEIDSDESIQINQELAWPVKIDSLVPRNNVRLDCALSDDTRREENIGYFIIDIKPSKETIRKTPRWYKLITTHPAFKKSEIEVIVYYEYKSNEISDLASPIHQQIHSNTGQLESIDDEQPKQPNCIILDDSLEQEIKLNFLLKRIENLNNDLLILGNFKLKLQLDSTVWKFDIEKSKVKPEIFLCKGSNVPIIISGTELNISNWINNCSLKFMLFIGSKLVGFGKLELSIIKKYQNKPIETMKIPIKLSNVYFSQNVGVADLFIEISVKKHAINGNNSSESLSAKRESNEIKESFSDHKIYDDVCKSKKNLFNITIDNLKLRLSNLMPDEIYIKYKYKLLNDEYKLLNTGVTKSKSYNSNIIFPKSDCTIQFIANYDLILDCLYKNDFIIELWTISKNIHICIGSISFKFRELFETPGLQISKDNGSNYGLRRSITKLDQTIVYCIDTIQYPAQLDYRIILDIWNTDLDVDIPFANSRNAKCDSKLNQNNLKEFSNYPEQDNLLPDDNLKNCLHKKVLDIHNELEWKSEIEKSLIKSWEIKEAEQKKQLMEKFRQYEELEDKLNALIGEFEQKKNRVYLQEIRIKNMKNQMNFEFEKKEFALNEKFSKATHDLKTKLADKDNKIMELNDEKKRLIKIIKQLEVKNENVERKYDDYVSKNNPEIIFKLKSEIEILSKEKSFMSRELEIKSKNLDDIIKQNFSFHSNEKPKKDIGFKEENLNSKNLSSNNSSCKDTDIIEEINQFESIHDKENIISSTKKLPAPKLDSVDDLVKEIDSQINQVLVDLKM